MKEYAKRFYSSKAWQKCRTAYKAYRGGLCERCLARGEYVAGVIVHHKCYITPENINDPNVTLSWDNLELVCRACHDEEHELQKHRRDWQTRQKLSGNRFKRWTVGDDGRISPRCE